MYLQIDEAKHPIKAWVQGVLFENQARQQLLNIANLPFIHPSGIAVMPDVHKGKGATVGSVIPTVGAIIPAAVGVDIGCGMIASCTTLKAKDLPDNLRELRNTIETFVPHGRTKDGGKGDVGAWDEDNIPDRVVNEWKTSLEDGFKKIVEKHPHIEKSNHVRHLGSLGGGNHFIEICLDEEDRVWVMLHSGSRGVGNRIGSYFIKKAKEEMGEKLGKLPDKDLAYLTEDSQNHADYLQAVLWAQKYASVNRAIMFGAVLGSLELCNGVPPFEEVGRLVNCHHNYISLETHKGENVAVTRKGAIRAGKGELGIIPGSMGAKSYIVEGLGNEDSYMSCSHGAGRVLTRTKARELFDEESIAKATEGVECDKSLGVADEHPDSYKNVDDVMEAQKDLVKVRHTLKQILCVKGKDFDVLEKMAKKRASQSK